MKKILNFPALLLVVVAAMFLYSCESDPTGSTNVKPVVTLNSSSDITVDPGEVFIVDFSASKGDGAALKAVTIYEDGTKMPASRLTINGAAAAANAILITGDDVDGITWSIGIVAQSSATTTVAFEIEVLAVGGEKQSVFVNVTTVGTPPMLTATPPTNFEVTEGSKNAFKLTAVKGSGDLVSIEVRENDMLIDPSRLSWNGESMVGSNNPFLLGDTEVGGFDETRLEINLPFSVGTYVYKMTLTDEFGLTSFVEYNVTTLPSNTAIEMRIGVLLNSGGGVNTGGLDLDNGNSTNSDDEEAEIMDNGIDTDLPDDENWIRTISPIKDNGVAMKYLKAGEGGLPEGFTFASIEFKEDLADFFNNGIELVDDASNVVQIEDVFIVARDGNYWVLEVVGVTTDFEGNEDSYKFDIKY